MKTNNSKFQKSQAAPPRHTQSLGTLFRKWFGRPQHDDDVRPSAVPDESPKWRLNPLERIRDLVQVRLETAGGDFILEDADGLVHAKDFDEAVMLIERMWLYRP